MIRGRRFVCLAVRRPSGSVAVYSRKLSSLYVGPVRRIPLLRGAIVLIETLVLGVRALTFSANVAIESETGGETELSWPFIAGMVSLSLALGVGLFFVTPLLLARTIEPLFGSAELLGNLMIDQLMF